MQASNIRFGIEIETIGQTRSKVATAINSVLRGRTYHAGGYYDAWKVEAPDGRVWTVMSDSSLNAPYAQQSEIVSPIMTSADIELIQRIVRAVRRAGAKVDASCGIHLHLDGAAFKTEQVIHLVNIWHKNEEIIEHAMGVYESRRRYCAPIEQAFMKRLAEIKPKTMEELKGAWYGRDNHHPHHYDSSRYRHLNLHPLWCRTGTIEIRTANATLHAGKIKAWIQFCLAIAEKARKAKRSSAKKRPFDPSSAKYDLRVFLLGLGMIGDEFKTARLHLLANCAGDASWKRGRPQS